MPRRWHPVWASAISAASPSGSSSRDSPERLPPRHPRAARFTRAPESSRLMTWPSHFLVEARLPSRRIPDETAAIAAKLDTALAGFEWAGRRVALAVGSRGIDRIAGVVRAVAGYVKRRNALP